MTDDFEEWRRQFINEVLDEMAFNSDGFTGSVSGGYGRIPIPTRRDRLRYWLHRRITWRKWDL